MNAIVNSTFRRQIDTGVMLTSQFTLLWIVARVADWIVRSTAVPVPSTAIGLALMLILLATGAIRLSWVEQGANILVRHLTVFFLPITVGLSALADQFAGILLELATVLVASTLAGIATAGIAARRVSQQPSKDNAVLPLNGTPAITAPGWPDPETNYVLVSSERDRTV
jgi:holin-like protein